MDLTGALKSAENRYKKILEDFFVSVYNKHDLPSHGLEHHRRVWKFAKELVIVLSEKDQLPEEDLPPKLIIATYLHDIGMVRDHGPEHGVHSARLCEEFMKKNNLEPDKYPGLLKAIADHDNKDYLTLPELNPGTILSVADDLDALGFMGIYRYLEIYSLRGIKPAEISSLIISNCLKRYTHFAELFGDFPSLVEKHKKRYQILEDFFSQYEIQIKSAPPAGPHMKIVEMLRGIGSSGESLESLIHANIDSGKNEIRWFFEGMKSEQE